MLFFYSKWLAVFVLGFCALPAIASDDVQLPKNDKERLYDLNQTLSAKALLNAYMSDDKFQRRLAEAFALGALNATQGIVWCDYSVLSPDAFREQIYTALKQHQDDAAAYVLVNHFAKLLPCRAEG
jgi:hypothetical protein